MKCFNEFESSCLCFFFFNDTIIWLDVASDAFYVLLISFLLLFLLLHFTVTKRDAADENVQRHNFLVRNFARLRVDVATMTSRTR